jgi:DNA polymerase-3 subunit delta'
LPWHGAAWQRFNEQLQQQRLPHAILLAGPMHTGLERLALALARLLLCESPSGGLNCGRCRACDLSASGSHGDFLWLEPEGGSRVIKIDQVREAVGLAYKTASFGARTVIVLDPADRMNSAAANALLKSLEEPSPGTHLILTCTRLHALPPTIRSRCQLTKLPVPSQSAGLSWLDLITGDRGTSEQLLAAADGLPLLAEAMFRESDQKEALAAHLACRALLDGTLDPAAVASALAAAPAPQVLDSAIRTLQSRLRQFEAAALRGRQGRAVIGLLDELGQLRLAVEGGANPNMALLAERIVGKVQQILGPAGQGDNIEASQGRI